MAHLAFFGTPDFSLPSLKSVFRFCENFGHKLSLVVTQQDKPQGRGKHLTSPPVKQWAQAMNLNIAQPLTLKKNTLDGDLFFEQFISLNIDLAIVVAYGKIIPERLLLIPTQGFVNVHASLLPRWRGAAPIQRAIEAQDRETGICLMDMVKGLDEGDIYLCEKTPILSFDTSETLFCRLAHLGAHLLYLNLKQLLQGKLSKVPQAESSVVYAHMVNKEEGLLDFNLPGKVISQKVLAFDPWPGTFGFIHKKRVKFFASFFIAAPHVKKAYTQGTIVVINESFLGVKVIDGIVYFQKMQVEGKKILSIKEALLGFPISIGDKIEGA